MGAVSEALPLQERVPVKNNVKRASDLVILFLLIAQLYCRLSSLHSHGTESDREVEEDDVVRCSRRSSFRSHAMLRRIGTSHPYMYDDLPAVDMFVTTADPKLEPPTLTVNTVLSLLAVEYPAHKLACYVSDDACSAITYYALVEAAEFARSWVPFCKKHKIRVRAPFMYFAGEPDAAHSPSSDFRRDWQLMKNKYEELVRRIHEESRAPLESLKGEGAHLSKFERGNHPSIVKVIWENSDGLPDGVPHLIYVSREKRPKHPHHYKAGAMNVLVNYSPNIFF
ncbi:hypothetical protein Taro_027290 [Colocasia esculenta]|uniref:Uncharacterized protein n=1 Tax=Colocasia esculenta TaxID=4460 RepID=A0A843V8C2_COLES|nr:hypothetical protein [Colocasia esculenta]